VEELAKETYYGSNMINTIAAIAAGGALGAVARYATNIGITKIADAPFPYGTMTVNIIGSFAMGMLIAFFLGSGQISNEVKMFLTVGFLGSFTTFATFSLDAMALWTQGNAIAAMTYILTSVTLSIAAVFLGSFVIWKIMP